MVQWKIGDQFIYRDSSHEEGQFHNKGTNLRYRKLGQLVSNENGIDSVAYFDLNCSIIIMPKFLSKWIDKQ